MPVKVKNVRIEILFQKSKFLTINLYQRRIFFMVKSNQLVNGNPQTVEYWGIFSTFNLHRIIKKNSSNLIAVF